MMKYPYDAAYRPPFPVARVAFHNSEEGLRTAAENALLDTGSDGSLVPISYLWEILAPALRDTRIRSHWGEWRPVQLFLIDLELGELMLQDIVVVGDEQGEEVILGRNVLNRLRIILDGPARHTEIPRQEPL
jgi:predicted aspartyl protease